MALVQSSQVRECVRGLLRLFSLLMNLREIPIRTARSSVLREEIDRRAEMLLGLLQAFLLEQHDSEGQPRLKVARVLSHHPRQIFDRLRVLRDARAVDGRLEGLQRDGETLLEIFVEVAVELVHADVQEALHQLRCRPSVPVSKEHVPNDLKSPAVLDKGEHERRLQIRIDDLLGVVGLHETGIQLAYR